MSQKIMSQKFVNEYGNSKQVITNLYRDNFDISEVDGRVFQS